MNINEFRKTTNKVQKDLDFIKLKLTYEKKISFQQLARIKITLNKLEKSLSVDSNYLKNKKIQKRIKSNRTAEIVISMKSLDLKLNDLKLFFTPSKKNESFLQRIKELNDEINRKIHFFTFHLESQSRLPFNPGKIREILHQEVKQNLQLQTIKGLFKAQKEFFHFMSNHFDEHIKNSVDVESYCGNSELYSLESWKDVLCQFIYKTSVEQHKKIGEEILDIINQSIPIVVKYFSIGKLCALEKKECALNEIEYLKDLVQLNKKERKKTYQEKKVFFLNKYELKNRSPIPLSVLYNEIAWDMMERIAKLRPGERAIFPIGIATHLVLAEILCQTSPDQEAPGNYQWKIFNTGLGAQFHVADPEDANKICPLVYKGIAAGAFSYDFFTKLIDFSLKGNCIQKFYGYIEDHLVRQNGAAISSFLSPSYEKQKFGTCSYTCVEAWLASLLDPKGLEFLTNIKINSAILKQALSLEILTQTAESKFTGPHSGDGTVAPIAQAAVTSDLIVSGRRLLHLAQAIFKKRLEAIACDALP